MEQRLIVAGQLLKLAKSLMADELLEAPGDTQLFVLAKTVARGVNGKLAKVIDDTPGEFRFAILKDDGYYYNVSLGNDYDDVYRSRRPLSGKKNKTNSVSFRSPNQIKSLEKKLLISIDNLSNWTS